MAEFRNSTFTDSDVPTDGQRFVGCTLTRCKLVYSGGELPYFDGCTMIGCEVLFTEAAARTIVLMRDLYAAEPGFIEGIISQIIGKPFGRPAGGTPGKIRKMGN